MFYDDAFESPMETRTGAISKGRISKASNLKCL